MAKRYRVTLTCEERDALGRMISRGKADARKLAHARVLLQADAAEGGPGWTDTVISEAVRVSVRTIERVRQRFVEEGLEAALLPKPSPRVYAHKLDGEQEARLIALACSAPSRRCARRSKKNVLKPHLRRMWCIPPQYSAEFVWHMEDVLEVYQRPPDPKRPVVCLDECSKQLIGEVRAPLPPCPAHDDRPGREARYDCEYVRRGTANPGETVFRPCSWPSSRSAVGARWRSRSCGSGATGRASSAIWWTGATRTPTGSCWL